MARDPHFRAYQLIPGDPIVIEVRAANGQRFTLRGTVDSVPWLAGEAARKVVIRDATAQPVDDDDDQAAGDDGT